MSSYPNTLITNAGLDLIAEANAQGEALIFTKVKLGDGSLPEGQSIQTMTALISPKLESELTSGSVKNGQAKLRFSVENSGLDEGFFAREVGVFAKVGEEGTETLYAYTNGGNYVDYIPNKDVPIDAQIMDVYIVTGNAATVQIQVDSAAYATVLDLEEHDSSAASHPLTIDDTVAPTSDSAPMATILNNLATMLKSISGETGWKSVPAKSLAALVSSLSTGITVAADGTFSNPTLGITGLMAQNGYICFGKNFGGLILQWRADLCGSGGSPKTVAFNIAFKSASSFVVVATHSGQSQAGSYAIKISDCTASTIKAQTDHANPLNAFYIAVGL